MKKTNAKGLTMTVIGMGMIFGVTGVSSATPITWSSNGHQYEAVGSGKISRDNHRMTNQDRGKGWDKSKPASSQYWGNDEPKGNASKPSMILNGRGNNNNWAWNDYTGAEATFVAGSVAENNAPAPVPEPATMLLLGTGLVGLAGIARRRVLPKQM